MENLSHAYTVTSKFSKGDILCIECFKADFIDYNPWYSFKYKKLYDVEHGVTCDICEKVIRPEI